MESPNPNLQPERPTVSPEKGIKLLEKKHMEGIDVRYSGETERNNWITLTRICLEKAFGRNHPNIDEFLRAPGDTGDTWVDRIRLLPRYIKELELEIGPDPSSQPEKPRPEKLQAEKPTVSPQDGIDILLQQITTANQWLVIWSSSSREIDSDPEYRKWLKTTVAGIEKAFGRNHSNIEYFLKTEPIERPRCLLGYLEELEFEKRTPPEEVIQEVKAALSKKIFIVHGHDGELKEATARLVSQLDLEPVILHEQPRQGRPIIENFSIHAKESGFAIVLLTDDDVGSAGTVAEHAPLQPRARQNVVFEMGFFFGLLGQARVCAVHDIGVEMPSDLGGILYIPYDAPGRWRWDIAREIRAAGYEVDLNKL